MQVADDGQGDVEMSWNSGQPHAFAGVTTTVIQAQRALNNEFTIKVTPDKTSPPLAVAAIEPGPHRPNDSVRAKAFGSPLGQLQNEHGGLTVETDSK